MNGKVIYVDFTQKQQKTTSKKLILFKKFFYRIKKIFTSAHSKDTYDNVIYPFKKIL